jgi:hypothetical protein
MAGRDDHADRVAGWEHGQVVGAQQDHVGVLAGGKASRHPPRTVRQYRAHPDYGNRSTASRVAAELAPQAGLARFILSLDVRGGGLDDC